MSYRRDTEIKFRIKCLRNKLSDEAWKMHPASLKFRRSRIVLMAQISAVACDFMERMLTQHANDSQLAFSVQIHYDVV